jgi:hypothetical protein
MKTFITLLIAIAILGGLVFFIRQRVNTNVDSESVLQEATTTNETTATATIEDYVRSNISSLSPDKEVLGGTFYITDIEAHGGTGTVSYEDGHVNYTADFTYTIDQNGKVTITSFKTRE